MPSRHLSSRYTTQPSTPPPSVPPTSPRSALSVGLHVVALASLSNSFRLLLFAPGSLNEYMGTQYGGHWQFLTILSLAVSWLTFAAALAKDALPNLGQLDTLKTALSTLAVPIEGLVSVLYWGMQAIDPSLLVPPDATFILPTSLDLSIHALPAFFLWLDFLAFSPRMSSRVRPNRIAAGATVAYTLWMEHVARQNARGGKPWFPYPFLNDLTQTQRLVFYVCQIPVLIGLFHAANGVHRLVRGNNPSRPQAQAIKKLE